MSLQLGKGLKELKNALSQVKKLWSEIEEKLKDGEAEFVSQINGLKAFLKSEYETYLEAKKKGTLPAKGGMEGAPLLYAAIIDDAEIIDEHIKLFLEGQDAIILKIGNDGTVWGTGIYEQLDYKWSIAVITLLENILNGNYHDKKFPTLPSSYQNIPMESSVKIAVIGDWGAGYVWTDPPPNKAVVESVKKMNPDIIIHLGDVYYAGTKAEEINNLANIFPQGAKGSYALNSNHEMYSIAIPYFRAVEEAPFGEQFNSSYFAFENDNWIIACLDTAFFAPVEKMFLPGSIGGSDSVQGTFLKELISKAKAGSKDLILMSHHNGFEGSGLSETTAIWEEITGIISGEDFAGRVFWEWGHAHSGYSCKPVNNIYGRCIGHGAIPWGKGSDFFVGSGSNLNWFEDKTQTVEGKTLLMNGFMMLELNGSNITETFYDQNGNESKQLVNGS